MKEGGAQAFAVRRGAWRLRYDSAKRLELKHTLTGTRLRGALTFTVGDQAWTLTRSRDDVADRPAWLDADGNVQGYLAFRNEGDRLEIMVLHRCAQSYAGIMRFDGVVEFGSNSFACRTQAPAATRLVQMASGPADSRLNNALFDLDSDTVLRFVADSVQVTSGAASTFNVQLSAQVADAARSVLAMDLQRCYYASRYVPHYRPIDKARCPSPPTGWMSWNVYFDTAGAAENLAEARYGARHLRPFGLEFWSIESWQANSDRLPVSAFHNLDLSCHPGQFPEGMKKLAEDIRALGFRPGIWTVPFGTGDRAFYEAHREWFLHDETGTPRRNWSGLYVLDPSQAAARDHMSELHRVMSEEWGYEFFKVDGMSGRQHGYSAHFYERDEVRRSFRHPCSNPMKLCVQALRDGMGAGRIFLACQGHYSGPEAGVADAARIGGDIVAPQQPSTWHNIRSQASSTLNQLFVHNILWYNDPDTLLVGAFHGLEQARVTATVVALPGQMMFAGDKLAELPPERLRLLQQALPVCDVRPLDLFPIFDLRPVWDLKIRRSFGQWDLVALFNWTDQDSEVEVSLDELGLASGQSYLLYEFWESRFHGRTHDVIRLAVPARGVRVVAVHADLDRPQFLSTDRHITQGATSLESLSWDEARQTLSVEVKLVGGHASRLRFAVPPAYRLSECSAEAGADTAVISHAEGLLDLELCHPESRTVLLTLRF
jgi:hypothetical protein